MFRLLVSILLRQANANSPTDPAAWLTALQSAKWEAVSAQQGHITGTMVNGKSVTISAAGGFTLQDVIAASEVALQCIANDLTALPGRTQAALN